jgi:hypothetical protein
MGLDIYFKKVKPGKNVNPESIEELDQYNNKIVKDRFRRKAKGILEKIDKAVDITTRTNLITELREYVKELMGDYDWYYNDLTPELTNEELKEKVSTLNKTIYARENVYFRKVNFVYAFFSPYLENESCIVTKDMVRELIGHCDKVIQAAKEDNLINDNNEIINLDDFYYHYREGENWLNISQERRQQEEERINTLSVHVNGGIWIRVAEEELPTQSGFFFGSTEYDIYYLVDVLDCKKKFEKLLQDWKA